MRHADTDVPWCHSICSDPFSKPWLWLCNDQWLCTRLIDLTEPAFYWNQNLRRVWLSSGEWLAILPGSFLSPDNGWLILWSEPYAQFIPEMPKSGEKVEHSMPPNFPYSRNTLVILAAYRWAFSFSRLGKTANVGFFNNTHVWYTVTLRVWHRKNHHICRNDA